MAAFNNLHRLLWVGCRQPTVRTKWPFRVWSGQLDGKPPRPRINGRIRLSTASQNPRQPIINTTPMRCLEPSVASVGLPEYNGRCRRTGGRSAAAWAPPAPIAGPVRAERRDRPDAPPFRPCAGCCTRRIRHDTCTSRQSRDRADTRHSRRGRIHSRRRRI